MKKGGALGPLRLLGMRTQPRGNDPDADPAVAGRSDRCSLIVCKFIQMFMFNKHLIRRTIQISIIVSNLFFFFFTLYIVVRQKRCRPWTMQQT